MHSNALFILKVTIISAIISAVIKYACPYIPAIASGSLTVADINAIALSAIILPVALFGVFLWWKR